MNLSDESKQKVMEWLVGNDTGISSKTIVTAIICSNVAKHTTPSDSDDFGRCYRLLKTIPELSGALPNLAASNKQWAALVSRWDILTDWYEQGKYKEVSHLIRELLDASWKGDPDAPIRLGDCTIRFN